MKRITIGVFMAFILTCFGALWAQEASSGQTDADNTRVNKRDQQPSEPTAEQQKERSSDRELAQQIRRAIVKDDSLSTYAHNVKVIVQNGSVTLKGPVRSSEEKQAIESKAAAIAGAGKIKNELEIAPEKDN
jgi:hyperosmotically inducible periplasmic protein